MSSATASQRFAPPWLEFVLATISGVLCFLVCSYFSLHLVAWIALLPLFWMIDNSGSATRSIYLCWWAGLVASFGTCHWMVLLLVRFSALPMWAAVAVHLLFSAYQGLVFFLFGWIVRVGRTRLRMPLVLIAPPAMVAAQYLVPFLFPYGLEMSQAYQPSVIQIADLLGRYGVAALIVIVNAALYELAVYIKLLSVRSAAATSPRALIVGSIVICAALSYAPWRIWQLQAQLAAATSLRVGLVQPNVAYNSLSAAAEAAQGGNLLAQQVIVLHRRSQQLAADGAQLVVWSEVSYPFRFQRQFQHDFPLNDQRTMTSGVGVPLIAGAFTSIGEHPPVYNSALIFAADGSLVARYDKNVLVPFGEYLPPLLNFSWVRTLMQGLGDALQPGADPYPVSLANPGGGAPLRLGVLICYEDVLPGLTRRIGRAHPDLLINLSNDAWFGGGSEPWQHLAMSIYAAVEQRTSLIRAVNPGVSALIDPVGRVIAHTEAVDLQRAEVSAETLSGKVALLRGGYSVYDVIGNLFADLCLLASAMILMSSHLHALPRRGRSAPA